MKTMTDITLKIKYTEQEIVNESRKFFFRGFRIIPIVIYVFVFILGFVYLFFQNEIYYGIFFILFGLVLIIITLIRYYALPAREFRRNPQFQEEVTMVFSENGIYARHEKTGEIKKQWDFYDMVMEDDESYFIFIRGSRQYTFIPKRAFASKKQEEAFRKLLSAKVSKEFIRT